MENSKIGKIPLASFGSTILAISVSLFMESFFSLRHAFPFIFSQGRVWIVFAEAFFAYLVGFIIIVTSDENLQILNKKTILNIFLIAGITILLIFIGVTGFSFEHLNISSFTVVILALIYSVVNSEKSHMNTRKLMSLGGLFFAVSLSMMFPGGKTELLKADISPLEPEGGANVIISTELCQDTGNAMNISAHLIILSDYGNKSIESLKTIDFLAEGTAETLHWHMTIPSKNTTHTLYLFVWSNLGVSHYKIEIPQDIERRTQLPKEEIKYPEYLTTYYCCKIKQIYQSFRLFFTD